MDRGKLDPMEIWGRQAAKRIARSIGLTGTRGGPMGNNALPRDLLSDTFTASDKAFGLLATHKGLGVWGGAAWARVGGAALPRGLLGGKANRW